MVGLKNKKSSLIFIVLYNELRWKMKKEKIIEEILKKEWKYFSNLNNIGGRADCQDNREDFIIMRKSQWETFNEETLAKVNRRFNRENRNTICRKAI